VNISQQCYMIFRADMFAKKMMQSRFKFLVAIGGMIVNFSMAYSYATVLSIGYAEYKRRKRE